MIFRFPHGILTIRYDLSCFRFKRNLTRSPPSSVTHAFPIYKCGNNTMSKAAFFRRFNQAEDNGAAFGPAGRIGEQEVLPVNNKRLYAALRPVITDFQSAVLQVVAQVWPLLLEVSEGFAQSGLGCGGSHMTFESQFVHQRIFNRYLLTRFWITLATSSAVWSLLKYASASSITID